MSDPAPSHDRDAGTPVRPLAAGDAEPHEPTPSCAIWHCAWHNVDEAAAGYQICGECLHTFVTIDDLIAAHAVRSEAAGVLPPDLFFMLNVCPLCAHDL